MCSSSGLDELTAYLDPAQWARLGQLLAGAPAGTDLLIHVVPVLPPYLRPITPLPEGHWVSADLNDLYRRVVNRASRLRRLIELAAPDEIIAQEHRFLAEAVHMLCENEDCREPATDPNGRPMVSLRTLAVGNRLFEALTELEQRPRSEAALPRTLHHPIAALHAIGLELRR